MTVSEVLNLDLHTDRTTIEIIRPTGSYNMRIRGYWYEDHILKYENKEIEKFEWEEDGDIIITLKEEDDYGKEEL